MTIENTQLKQSILERLQEYLNIEPRVFNKDGEINSNIHKMITNSVKDDLLLLYGKKAGMPAKIYAVQHGMLSLPKCEICGNDVIILRNKKVGFAPTCSLKCSRKHHSCIDARKATILEKYGVQNIFDVPEFLEKRNNTNIERWGNIQPTKNPIIQNKITNTLLKNYQERGEDIKSQKFDTMLQRYGQHSSLSPSVIEKRKNTNLEKYGVESASQSELVKKNIQQSTLKNHGSVCWFTSEAGKKLHLENIEKQINTSKQRFISEIQNIGNITPMRISEIAENINRSYSSTLIMAKRHGIVYKPGQSPVSGIEDSIFEYVKTLCHIDPILRNDRTLLAGKEIDILVPDHKLAIEVNGIYWHTEQYGKGKQYHLNKTNNCNEKNYQLLHIYDIEWTNQRTNSIWKNMIKSRVGLNDKIFARKCQIREVTKEESNIFLQENHLQGVANGLIRIGLYHNETLVQLAVIGKSRYNKKYEYELLRMATIGGYTIVGGVSKLSKLFPKSLISYADLRYSTGIGYERSGFEYLGNTQPGYRYQYGGELKSRIQFQKHKLSGILKVYDEKLTEAENMKANDVYRIWDCGHKIYVLK